MKILLISFLSLLFSVSCSIYKNGDGDNANVCNDEIGHIREKIKQCDSEITSESLEEQLSSSKCLLYLNHGFGYATFDDYKKCIEEIDVLSCDELKDIYVYGNGKSEKTSHCFNFPKYNNKSICEKNVNYYCVKVFESCGYDKVPDYCHKTGTHKNDEGHGIDRLDMDKEKINVYCEDTVNGEQEIEDLNDFYETIDECRNSQIDCNNIKEVDFRNADWKNECSE